MVGAVFGLNLKISYDSWTFNTLRVIWEFETLVIAHTDCKCLIINLRSLHTWCYWMEPASRSQHTKRVTWVVFWFVTLTYLRIELVSVRFSQRSALLIEAERRLHPFSTVIWSFCVMVKHFSLVTRGISRTSCLQLVVIIRCSCASDSSTR